MSKRRSPARKKTKKAGPKPAPKSERLLIADLHLDPANMRKHDERNLKAITASLKRFGQQRDILIDADNLVRAGNGTLAAANLLGWTEIDCRRSNLRGAEMTAYAIADNRTAELASWEDDVGKIVDDLRFELPDLDVQGLALMDIGVRVTDDVIPEGNEQIDEEAMAKTKNQCPKCGFGW